MLLQPFFTERCVCVCACVCGGGGGTRPTPPPSLAKNFCGITVVPELMKISHFFSCLSDSKDQKIIEKVLLANDRGN